MMRTFRILLTVVATVVLSACGNGSGQQNDGSPAAEHRADAVLENIRTRVTVRAYQNKPVEAEKVEKLLRAGMAAPTALNAQPWHFIVITDHELLRELSVVSPHTGVLASAPMAIAVCGDLKKALDGDERAYWIQDVAAATENILLAAHSMGLGATWTGSFPVESRHQTAERVLGLPSHIKAVSIVAIGYPAIQPGVKYKYKEENISYNLYGQRSID